MNDMTEPNPRVTNTSAEPADPEVRLRALIAEVALKDTAEIGLDDDLVATIGLDSLAGLRVLAAVEKRFGVRFRDEQLSALRTMRRILDAARQHQTEAEAP